MSAGDFKYSRYEADNGNVYRIRIQPETENLAIGAVSNGPPAGAINSQGTVRVSNGKRAFGVTPRAVTLQWVDTPPAGYDADGYVRVPILEPTTYTGYNLDETGTYLGQAVKVVGKSPEYVR